MTKDRPKRRRVLKDHRRRGKIYDPPFVAGLGDYPNVQGHTWREDVAPELMWIALLYRADPGRSGVLAHELAAAARRAHLGSNPPPFSLTTPWYRLSGRARARLRADLRERGIYGELADALAPLTWLYPECPLSHVFRRKADQPSTEHLSAYRERLSKAAETLLFRRMRGAAIVQGICVYATVASEAMSPQGLDLQDLPLLMDYPDSPASRRMEQTVRLTTTMLARTAAEDSTWRKYFWRQGVAISPCEVAGHRFHAGAEDRMETAERLVDLFAELSGTLEAEFSEAWSKVPMDLYAPQAFQVVGGLLARQVRYVRHMLITSRLLLDELGEPILRSMAESTITLAWLIRKAEPADWDRFVQFGLGQEKLALEHLATTTEPGVYLEDRRRRELAMRTEWLQGQRYLHMLSVDVSVNWASPKNLRELAEEADLIDIYNAIYTPTSAHVHGSWNAVGRTALRFCLNPLHGLHMVPDIETTRIDLTTIVRALRLLNTSWSVTKEWAQGFSESRCIPDALDRIVAILDAEPTSAGSEVDEGTS